MSFINEIKTILKLDDKDWKKALSSISEAEKSYVKESKKNTEALINTKQTLSSLEQKKAKELEEINKQIAKAEENKTKAIENGDKALIASMNKRLTLYKQQRREIESNSKIEIDQSKQSIKQIQETISTQDRYNKLLKIAKANHQEVLDPINKHNTSLSNLANTTIRYLRWAGTIAGVVYAGQRAWDLTLGKGIEVNKMLEDNTTGIAALLGANTSMILSNGKVVNSYEKFQMGLLKSKEIMDNIRVAAKSTYATFPQLTEIYQQAIGQTLSFGTSFGKTVDDISNNTVKLAQRMSNIGGAIGQPMDRIKEEIRSLVSGNVSTDSIISTMIFGSPSQANEAIKKAKEAGTSGLKDMLDSYLKAFDVLEGVKTYTKAQLDLQDAISQTQGQLAEPTFNALKEVFTDLALQINKMKDDKTFLKWGEDIVSTVKTVVEYADDVLIAFLGWKILPLTFNAVKIAITALSEASIVAGNSIANFGKDATLATAKAEALALAGTRIGTALKGLAVSLAPMAAVMVAYEGYNWLISDNIKKEETLKGIMSNKVDDLNKISTAQLQYNKLLLQESIINKEKQAQEAKQKAKEYGESFTAMWSGNLAEDIQMSKSQEIYQAKLNAEAVAAEEAIASAKEQLKNTESILITRENILKKSQEINATQKELGNLTVKMTRDAKVEEDVKSFIKKEEEEIVKLTKQKKEYTESLLKAEKQLAEVKATYSGENTIKLEDNDDVKKQQEYIKNLKEGIVKTDKAIAEENAKKAKVAITESSTIVKNNIKLSEQAAIRAEIDSILNGTYNTETYMVDVARRKVESAIEEYQVIDAKLSAEKDAYQQKLYQIELDKDLRDILVSQLEYEEKITKLQEKQNSFSNYKKFITTTGLNQESANQLVEGLRIAYAGDESSLADIQKFTENLQKQLDKKDLTVNIKFQGFDTLSESIASAANSFQDMRDAQAKYKKESETLVDDPIKLKQAQLDLADATMTSYSSMIGAMSSFYNEDDSRREKQLEIQKFMNATKMAMQLAELAQVTTIEGTKQTLYGTTALANALTAPFPANIPAFAAVAGMLASIGIMIGGSTKTSTISDAFSSVKENTGAGSVLGDTEKQTESIVNALSLLQDFAQPQYRTLQSMNEYLKNISDSIGGVTSLLIQQGGFAFGEGYKGFDSGYKNNLDWGNSSKGGALLLQPINSLISKIPLVGDINKMFGNIMGSVMGGLFGKTKVSQALTDSGIYFADTLLSSAIKEFNGQAYQTISTTTTKKSWFSKSSSTVVSSYFDALDSETNRQFSLVLDNLYNTVLVSGEALDTSSSDLEKQLQNFVVSIGKISLKGKTGDEIQSQLTAVFGKIGDDLTKSVFPLLTPFQKVGEGMFETLTRVSTGMEEAEYYINRLGKTFDDLTYTEILNPQGNIGFEALLQSITKTDSALYGLDNNLLQIISSLDSTAEELYGAYTALDKLRDTLKFLKLNTDAISFASIRGAGSIDALTSGISAYIDNFLTDEEKTAYQTALLQKEFAKLNVAMPSSKTAFTSLIQSLDLSSESGQELYGRLIVLSESFATVSDSVETSIKTLEDSLKALVDNGFTKFTDSLKSLFDLANELAQSTQTTIQNLKYTNQADNAEQLIRFNQLLKDFEVSKATTNTERTKSIYNEILSLSGTIGGDSQYKQDIIGKLNTQLAGFNIDKDIMRVSIVDGLGDLISLSQTQLSQLQSSVSDGKLTTDELNNISNLTQAQKDAILELANNSNYFSTEATLSNLEEYSKLQLDAYRASIAQETVGLSGSTLTYGDYIGKQEQIDIAKALGVSFESAKPLIKQIQSLSVSKNLQSDVNSLLGYTGTSYNATTANQLSRLSPYLSTDIKQSISNTTTTADKNLIEDEARKRAFEAAKAEFNTRYINANNIVSNWGYKYIHELYPDIKNDWWYKIKFGDMDTEKESEDAANYHYNGVGQFAGYGQNENRVSPAIYKQQLYNQYLQPLVQEKTLKGYAVGGYTGDGKKYDVAGIVHKGEYVINQEKIKSLGGQESVRQIVGGSLQKSLEFLSAINAKSLAKLDIISQNFIELLRTSKEHTTLLEASYIELRNIKGNTAP